MKNDAIVCNIGHFDLEIDMAWLNGEVDAGRASFDRIKPAEVGAVDKFTFADRSLDSSFWPKADW